MFAVIGTLVVISPLFLLTIAWLVSVEVIRSMPDKMVKGYLKLVAFLSSVMTRTGVKRRTDEAA